MAERIPFSTHGFALVVVRNFDGRWLAVKETRNRGWWLPAGLVDQGETFMQAAHRETLEEAGLLVEMKGILRIEHSVYGPTHARMRVIFFAVPVDPAQEPKKTSDKESEEARWVTLEDMKRLARNQPGLRGPELYEWGSYIEKGGMIAPMSFLCREDEPMPAPTPSFFRYSEQNLGKPEFSSLVEAVEQGNADILRKCLLSGVSPNASINKKLWTPLHLACKLNHDECVQLLLLARGDITASTHKKRNVVHFAAQSNPSILSMVLIRLSKLVNRLELINQQDSSGETPLHFTAAAFAESYMWQLLVGAGADVDILNKAGLSPTDVANSH
jgi:8-oxo-dGTP pyrophosphatase MutT (NUDIX family)